MRQVVNPRHVTLQGQSVAKPGNTIAKVLLLYMNYGSMWILYRMCISADKTTLSGWYIGRVIKLTNYNVTGLYDSCAIIYIYIYSAK